MPEPITSYLPYLAMAAVFLVPALIMVGGFTIVRKRRSKFRHHPRPGRQVAVRR